MRLVAAAPRGDGMRLVATFEADVGPLTLTGCRLLVQPTGEYIAVPPEANTRGAPHPVSIRPAALRAALLEDALRVFHSLTQSRDLDEADWRETII